MQSREKQINEQVLEAFNNLQYLIYLKQQNDKLADDKKFAHILGNFIRYFGSELDSIQYLTNDQERKYYSIINALGTLYTKFLETQYFDSPDSDILPDLVEEEIQKYKQKLT